VLAVAGRTLATSPGRKVPLKRLFCGGADEVT
jgi:hypothetical protein